MSEAEEAIEYQRREKFREFAQREESLKRQVARLEEQLSGLRRATIGFLAYPACEVEGLLVDLVMSSEGNIPLGEWWSDREDTPKVADLARLIEAIRTTD